MEPAYRHVATAPDPDNKLWHEQPQWPFHTALAESYNPQNSSDVTVLVLHEMYRIYNSNTYLFHQIAYVLISMMEHITLHPQECKSTEYLSQTIRRLLALSEAKISHNPYLVSRAIGIIQRSYDKDISLDRMARDLNVSRAYLCHVISAGTGCTYGDLLLSRRVLAFIERTITKGSPSLEDAALHIGFASIHYFSRAFKRFTGVTPGTISRAMLSMMTAYCEHGDYAFES